MKSPKSLFDIKYPEGISSYFYVSSLLKKGYSVKQIRQHLQQKGFILYIPEDSK